MSPKNKGQSIMDKFYGYSTMSKTSNVEDILYIFDSSNEDMDKEIVDGLEIIGHDKERQDGGSNSLRRRKTSSKCEF